LRLSYMAVASLGWNVSSFSSSFALCDTPESRKRSMATSFWFMRSIPLL